MALLDNLAEVAEKQRQDQGADVAAVHVGSGGSRCPRHRFNGRDLTGWEAEGEAIWEVKDGLLTGKRSRE